MIRTIQIEFISFSMDYMRRIRQSADFIRSSSSTSGKSKRKLNVNEEYKEVFRTKSYIEISSKVEDQLMCSRTSLDGQSSTSLPSCSSPLPFYVHLSDWLLEPSQETAMKMVKDSDHFSLLREYYNTSLEACNLCELLLRTVQKTRFQYRYIQRAIKTANGNNIQLFQQSTIADDFSSFASKTNPLSVINSEGFDVIHRKLSQLLNELTSKHKQIKRKMKIVRFCKRVLGYGLVVSYSVLAVALLVFAVHSIIGLIGIPGVLMVFPLGLARRRMKMDRLKMKNSQQERVCEQLDMAARGVYILINQLDTMGRLVVRLENEVEHKKAIAGLCARNYSRNQEVPREGLREFEMHEDGFMEQLDELEKHVYFCFLGINRSRRLVLRELMGD